MLATAFAASLAAAAPPPCTLAAAEPTTIREIAREPKRWLGRCVRLEGFTSGYTFYEDAAGLYRSVASDSADRPNDGWLGLYFSDSSDFKKGSRHASVAGYVDDCERSYDEGVAQADPGEIVMMVGYCHYRGGLVLKNVTARHGKPLTLTRLTGEKARLAAGDLLTEEEAGLPPATPLRLLSRFVTAVRADDSEAADAVADSYNENVGENAGRLAKWRSFLTRGPFAFLRKTPRKPVLFRTRQSQDAVKYHYQADWFACFCRATDCGATWPISAMDALADRDEAYTCVRLYRDTTADKPWKIGIETIKDWGFAAS